MSRRTSNPRQGEMRAGADVEYLINRSTAEVSKIALPRNEPVPATLREELLEYAAPEDFDDDEAVIMFSVCAQTTWWREKYGDDMDGNRGEWRTFTGDLAVTTIVGPRPIPKELADAIAESLSHDDFNWER
jgi:hypothetical protein